MYSGAKIAPTKYRVYKKDITTYRIEGWIMGRWMSLSNKYGFPTRLDLYNCKFVVEESLRQQTVNERLDGESAPVCAWIECMVVATQDFTSNILPPSKREVFFNPYRVTEFTDRETHTPLYNARKVFIFGNQLFYI